MITLALDIVTTAAILFIVAAGLLIVFGVMKIINFAHGAFLTVGGYAALVASRLGLHPCAGACRSPSSSAACCGPLTERARGAAALRAGRSTRSSRPGGSASSSARSSRSSSGARCSSCRLRSSGTIDLLGRDYSGYRLLLVVVADRASPLVFTGAAQRHAARPLDARRDHERDLAHGLGIDSARVRCSPSHRLRPGRLAGALITPLSSVDPNMGVPWLVGAFMLVMVSGVSLLRLAVACLVLGGAQVLVSTYVNPILGGLTIVVLAALVLRLRPEGFARA